MVVLTPLVQRIQIVLLLLSILTILMFMGSAFTRHVCEYLTLMLLATVSVMFLVSTQNLLLIFLSLELLSLSLYVLTAFNKQSGRSAEAAIKYFLFGGISAAFLLFGFSLLMVCRIRRISSALLRASMGECLIRCWSSLW